MDKISTYRGKPIEQMTREELIDALNFFAAELTAKREEHARRLDVLTGRAAQQAQADVCPSCGVDDWAYGDDTNTFEVCAMCGKRR